MEYLGGVVGSLLTTLFIVFAIAALGYLIGGIKIKGISLGTAGVLLVALALGIVFSLCGEKVGDSISLSFTIGGKTISLYNDSIKKLFDLVSNIGTAMFVTAVGLIAGPKFFRSFNKSMISYVAMGAIIIALGAGMTILISALGGMDMALGTGLLAGSLTSTPAFSAAKEAAKQISDSLEASVAAGYGIGYLYGVLGVVLFVQIMPKILKVNIEEERANFIAAGSVTLQQDEVKRVDIDDFGFFPFCLTVVLGLLIGAIKIPGINFSLGSSGGTLVSGLIVGHFGHVGKINLKVSKATLNFFRELGLMLFLIGAGVPAGIRFIDSFSGWYFLYGIILTTVPMVVGFILGKYVFKLSIFNNLGSITGGMTSTPALGSLINVAGTDDVSAAYAATYPIALVLIVIASNLMVTIGCAV
ncbi:MAG: YidE/YbjL duplication [Clostridia bacterium]|nr:YidE/YbjL duplication [Clostridia bacterium]